ncbi:MAG TPA: sigma-54 dependent transcriptional regulator [Polyangia bacterium]
MDRGELILVVDDAPDMQALVRRFLEADGFRVAVASHAAEAMACVDREMPELALIDLGLPGQTGDELYRSLRARAPGLPCAFLTANTSLDHAVALMRDGAIDYITKPIEANAFRVRMQALRDRLKLKREVEGLRTLCEPQPASPDLILGTERSMLDVVRRIVLIARTDAPVLFTGESGTGKEVCARLLHRASKRAGKPFVAVNAGAVPAQLWESQFFGHVRGAFTDARADAAGFVETAAGGTLVLDEVGEVPLELQPKLLRFLQTKSYHPVGSPREREADVRIVGATNRELREAVREGAFREDLFYRLNVVPVRVPPLRERRGDVPLLATSFLHRYAAQFGVAVEAFTPSALALLTQHDWPGNVRELENLVQQVVAVATRPIVSAADLPLPGAEAAAPRERDEIEPLKESRKSAIDAFERAYLGRLLELCAGNVTRAAQRSRVPRKTLARMLKRHGITATRDGVQGKRGRPRRQ